MEKPCYRISVRNLVEFMERSGDLDDRRITFDQEAMHKGSRLHKKIQKSRGKLYQAEVALKQSYVFEDMEISLEGRADGILSLSERCIEIEEIKGTAAGVYHLEKPEKVHLAQAKCYGAIYCAQENLEFAEIRMTYVDLNTEETKEFREKFTADELLDYVAELLEGYHQWLSFRMQWVNLRDASMENLSFPFPYREGQKKLVSSIYHSISEQKQIFIQAPTGTGKTMSAIYPAVRSLGAGKAEMIFYLTAKTITRTVALNAFQLLSDQGLKIKVIALTAKDKLCPMEERKCNPEECLYARGHFDRVNDAVFELLTEENIYTRDLILSHAAKCQVCPFEMALDLAVWTDSVICDYNYVFDPDAYLKRFFGENRENKYIFLVDEAHNLADRARDMYSASLSRSHVLEARKKAKGSGAGLTKALNKVNRQLLALEKEEELQVLENPGTLPLDLLHLQGEIDRLRENPKNRDLLQELSDFYFEIRSFLNISELLDDSYLIYTDRDEQQRCMVKLYCVNPANNLKDRFMQGVSTSFFSATLLPMNYYRQMMSIRTDDFGLYLPSPFPKENRKILISNDVNTIYSRRGYEEYRRIAAYISKVLGSKQGNYMIFFPSYRMLREVNEIYENEFALPWIQTICQEENMREQDREQFLEAFAADKGAIAGFCIMGGVFSEGIDLTGEKLIGTVVVGAGLPMVTKERELLKQFYEKREAGSGFDYAYRFPGLNKVLQAAGRVIRTKEDRGIIVLLDDRFLRREYARYLPQEWNDQSICSLSTIEGQLRSFWDAT